MASSDRFGSDVVAQAGVQELVNETDDEENDDEVVESSAKQ